MGCQHRKAGLESPGRTNRKTRQREKRKPGPGVTHGRPPCPQSEDMSNETLSS